MIEVMKHIRQEVAFGFKSELAVVGVAAVKTLLELHERKIRRSCANPERRSRRLLAVVKRRVAVAVAEQRLRYKATSPSGEVVDAEVRPTVGHLQMEYRQLEALLGS